MSFLSEKQILALISNELDVLEPRLRLVDTEHHVPNSHGTRGFIDILARDRHGMWVVIELKRSTSTAREALHEVAKYTELLRAEMGVRQDMIRSIIVSTTWKELLAPASNLARDWDHDLRGYKLFLDGRSISHAQPIAFLAPPAESRLTPVHSIHFYSSPADRDRDWKRILDSAEQIGAYDLVAVDLNYAGPPSRVVGDYALYLAIGTMPPEAIDLYNGPINDVEGNEPPEDQPPESFGHPLEYRAMCHICNGARPITTEIGTPDRFSQIRTSSPWNVSNIRRSGTYKRATTIEDIDLIHELSGRSGGALVKFTGSANPRIKSRWKMFTSEVSDTLSANPPWQDLTRYWLDDVSDHPTDSDVMIHIYNPCDLIQTLVFGFPDQESRGKYSPQILGFAVRNDAPSRGIVGRVSWNGNTIPDVIDRVEHIYRDPLSYLAHRYGGEVWRADQELLNLIGLQYTLLETEAETLPTPEDTTGSVLLIHNGTPQRISPPYDYFISEGMRGDFSLWSFVEQHYDQVALLIQRYQSELGMGVTDTPY